MPPLGGPGPGLVARKLPASNFGGRKVLVILLDGARTLSATTHFRRRQGKTPRLRFNLQNAALYLVRLADYKSMTCATTR